MTTAPLFSPDPAREAIAQATAVLDRARARLATAHGFAARASQMLEQAQDRADWLQGRMADVKYAARPAA